MKFKLVDADNRLSIKFNKQDAVWSWGDDNSYPQLIKSLIGSSVTAKNCCDVNSKYIYGKGFDSSFRTNVVNKEGHTINQLFRIASKEFSEQNNLFIHINYNAAYEIISATLLPATDVRVGKSDSTNYSSKFILYSNWDRSKNKKIDKKDFIIIDKFNPLPMVIDAQVEVAGGWNKYKGQILHVSSDFSSIYGLSDGDSVLTDMDSEYQASVFKNSGLRRGFFGAKLFVTKPFSDDMERKDFQKTISDLKGAENSSGVLLLEAERESEDLKNQFLIENIDTNINDKMFESTEASTAKNIRKAFGVPSILIEDSDNSIFGNSGELLIQAKKMHWENKEEERNMITDAFNTVFSKWHQPLDFKSWSIIPIIQEKVISDEPINN